MAAFLRRATLSRKKRTSLSDPPLSPPTAEAPPSLPPLLLSSSFADPDPGTRDPPALPPAAAPPVLVPPPVLPPDDHWDPWKAYAVPVTAAPVPASTRPTPVATAPTARTYPPQDARPRDNVLDNQPKRPLSSSSSSPPAVVRGQMPPPSTFDFEEFLSAANVTSVVNQFRSYPPPIRHHPSPAPPSQTSQMASQPPLSSDPHRHHASPQKPGSSSSLSSTSHHTDATRRTNGSYGTSTSASSLSPATEVIDVVGRLDPVGSSLNTSHPPLANATSRRIRTSSVDHNLSSVASPASRPCTSSHVPSRVHRPPTAPSVPPTSYPDRTKSLARHASASSAAESHTRPPMLYDMLRSGNPELANPVRKGPLIFAAMAATTSIKNPYPSPPAEHASLEASPAPPPRKSSLRTSIHADPRVQQAPVPSTEVPPLDRKSSKNSLARVAVERTPSSGSRGDTGSDHARPRVLTKARPTTPQKPGSTPSHMVIPTAGDPLLLDQDPFARVEGVRMLKPRGRSTSRSETLSSSQSMRMSKGDVSSYEDGQPGMPDVPVVPDTSPSSDAALTPMTPDDYKAARQHRRGRWLEKAPPPAVAEVVKQLAEDGDQVEEPPREPSPPPTYFPIMAFMPDANLLPVLLSHLSYSEWLALYSANKQIRALFQSRILREFVLERYLSTVGYSKWDYEWAEPLALSLKDLHSYLRGVAMPAHQYARLAVAYLHPKPADDTDMPDILTLAQTTRAYTRVVLRLRAQAESEAKYLQTLQSVESGQAPRPGTRHPSVSSRAPSPTSSNSHSRHHSRGKNDHSPSASTTPAAKFRSPLYRPGRAPVLRVFVPSPEGDWLSDASVVECEAELKRSGVLKLLRVGDIVWDVAVGDEGNLGRLIWDGSYLVDLDYRYSRVGELSPYFHSLAFSPSYFHRVIRIGGSATHNPHCNPIVHIDVSPWGHEIAANLQLLQDRARTETPHGALHDVVRWVHRSTFTIRPPVPSHGQNQSRLRNLRIPIPNSDGFFIDPGWYGTVVLEAEGTNEGLVDLQGRCGPGVFPPRAESLATKLRNEKEKENRRVWRILREKSRPGEIWLRAVQVQERLM